MQAQVLELSTLAGYVEHETERWRDWFQAVPPEVLDLPLGPGADGTVRTLVKHIFAVELRYAQRLVGEAVSGYDELADGTVEQLWHIHHTANATRGRYLADASAEALDRVLVSETRKLGRIESRAHTVLIHSLIHGIRHWAQVAMVLRQHGHGGLWEHDWLLSPAVQ
ncbi:DinB family protein [Longimicrobium sp.]|uniref:DinB family protein n=1 Tax=Longimicrobium sp. TaxID=2029185 RepID=UPI003B3B1086